METANETVHVRSSQVPSHIEKRVIKKLPQEEALRLIVRARKGEEKAMHEIVVRSADLVHSVAYRVARHGAGSFFPLNDLVQEGNIGLLSAVNNYDVSRGASFDTYAGLRIKGAIIDALRKDSPFPKAITKAVRTAERIYVQLAQQTLLRSPTLAEWKNALPVHVQEKFEGARLVQEFRMTFSLSCICETEDRQFSLQHSVSWDGGMATWERDEDAKRFLPILLGALSLLTEREKEVLLRRTLSCDEERFTCKELGEKLGISESRVSQIQQQVLMELRAYLIANYSIQTEEALERAMFY
ncbi:MAG: sigma-70 family RNA polymerase sigma factor [Patescibacteria group bacterium]